jgi:hypothetical protein
LPRRKSKPWQLAEWKQRRKEFLKGKSCEWCGSVEKLLPHHPQAPYSLTDEQYKLLEGTTVLCRRCHLALRRGLVLCKLCKKNYHEPEREMCWNCHKKSLPPEKVWELEYHPYKHPWCGKTFEIKGKWWKIEAKPSMCCIEHCEDDVNTCDIAEQHQDDED